MGIYYKGTQLDGFDWHTGRTINYRTALGSKAIHPRPNPAADLCSDGVLHASPTPEGVFIGSRIPLALFRVEGTPVVEDTEKAGFVELTVIEELDPAKTFRWNYAGAASPVNPLLLTPPAIDGEIMALVRTWASVGASVGASVWASVWDSVGDSVRASVGASVGASVWASVGDSVGASVRASVWASVRASVWDSVRDSVWVSVRASVWDSVGASVGAYIGSLFVAVVPDWDTNYPYQSAVDLWRKGLVLSYDGRLYRLHGHRDARILWEGTV
ncbi:hypothetical protein LCGC14_0312960 [marine sediment metagenome]|uniref:Uncharacterized protein n=1 Tax=marine sediment metagenome TaxID=412755 RepID=A0A0F9TRS2_9ZZZZ